MAANGVPRDHHYAPQFFLRNFAVDADRRKIATVTKNGHMAVWSVRSIERLGYERDFYVHMSAGAPISVETAINRRIETPISASDTWRKICAGRSEDLDLSDKPVLYALVRHLHARTPHAQQTALELAQMAADPNGSIPFAAQERAMYSALSARPDGMKAFLNHMSSTLSWSAEEFEGCFMLVLRSPIPIRSATTPVISLRAPGHQALKLPLPGMIPFMRVLTVNPETLICLVVGAFDGYFANRAISLDEARAFNRHFAAQFAHFDAMRHLISSREGLVEDMTWAPYDLVAEEERKIVFRRQPPRAAS